MVPFPQPHYLPCSDCGASVSRAQAVDHICDSERLVDYAVFQLRNDLERFEYQLGAYLETPRGRFEAWYAARRR